MLSNHEPGMCAGSPLTTVMDLGVLVTMGHHYRFHRHVFIVEMSLERLFLKNTVIYKAILRVFSDRQKLSFLP